MVPFTGFSMPVQYSGIVAEHLAVRRQAGIFDVSHMGEFIIAGADAEAFLQKVTVNDVSALSVWQAQYSAMCREDGGIIDDILIYKYPDHFMMVVNAANIDKDFNWLSRHKPPLVRLQNKSDDLALIAVQGPASRDILAACGLTRVTELAFYHFLEEQYAGSTITIARTGYTGELGFEIYVQPDLAPQLWDDIMSAGKQGGITPAGLGARDTLRLEMKYCLYGNDIDESTHPLEAGLGWITKLDKGDFIGRDSILEAKGKLTRRLVCLQMTERAVPRTGYEVFLEETRVGAITSGTQSPSLQQGIALAYIDVPHHKVGTEVEVAIRGRRKRAVIVKPPFYKSGTALI